MKKKKTLSFKEILELTSHLSKSQIRKINTNYAHTNNTKIDKTIEKKVLVDLQQRIIELKLDNSCPKCGSKIIIKAGQRNGIQRLRCKDCNTRFTYFTGTFLEKSKYHWDFWIEMIYLMLSDTPLQRIQAILETDLHCIGISYDTVFNWRQKLLEAAKNIPLPKLTGIVEIDETYVHESQKGSRNLIDPLNNESTRVRRETRKASKYGVMGPEFGNVICAVDQSGHVIAKHIGVGSCNEELFEKIFHPYISGATWICTDANPIYKKYARKYAKNHYVRPSEYLDNLYQGKKAGKSEELLYKAEMLDYIDLDGKIMYPFNVFAKIKEENHLSLSRVNEFHSEFKTFIGGIHGISLVYLDSYASWKAMLRNYQVDHGHPAVTRKDAEEILIMLLKTKTNLKVKDISTSKPDFSNVSKEYKNRIMRLTDEVRKRPGKEKFVLNPESIELDENRRSFLESLPVYMLRFLCDKCLIPGRSKLRKNHTYKFIKALEIHEDLEKAILDLYEIYG